jgi:hypothetical protein
VWVRCSFPRPYFMIVIIAHILPHTSLDVIGGYFQNQTVESDGTNLPTDQLCSSCVVSLFSLMQSTPYSNYDPTLANVWSNIQSQCSLSQPTAVPALDTNLTQPGGFALPGYSTSSALCLSGITYTVVSGDSCEAIAENYGVSTGTLIAINDLYVDCTNLGIGQVGWFLSTLSMVFREANVNVCLIFRSFVSLPNAPHITWRVATPATRLRITPAPASSSL